MGRITVFTTEDCRFCTAVKAALRQRGIPFTEINLTSHPSKRNDMLSLSSRLTVPQVFLNDLHIGGADETIDMMRRWDADAVRSPIDTYHVLVASADDPRDARLQPPDTPPVVEDPPPPRDEYNSVVLPDGTRTSVLNVTELLKTILPRRDLKYHLKTYKRSFKGSECIKALRVHYHITDEEAEEFALSLQKDHKVLDHVKNDHDITNTDSLYFRLQCDQEPHILNSYRKWRERVDPDVIGLINHLKKVIATIELAMTNSDGKVNYKMAHTHAMFPEFEEAVCEIQGVHLSQLEPNTRLAFCINLYNLMIKYAFMKVGIATTDLTRLSFFNNVYIQVGFDLLSFSDLENGVLRCNRKAPAALKKQFDRDDDRLRLIMPRVDNRIHFALNCGALSCPPVNAFRGDSIDQELRIVSQAFCEDDGNVRLDVANSTVHLSMIFSWYREDFCGASGKNSDLPNAILPFLRSSKKQRLELMLNSGNKIRVQFMPYDWSTNASEFVPFNGSALKANVTRIM